MQKILLKYGFLFLFALTFIIADGQETKNDIYYFKQTEQKKGVLFNFDIGREELRTDNTFEYDKLRSGSGSFQFSNRYWKLLDYKHEQLEFNFDIGPASGWGIWTDSSSVKNIEANQTVFGVKTNANISYSSRFYWNRNNYTIVEVGAWGQANFYNRVSEGTVADSNFVKTDYAESENHKKLRYGLQAKAGWGIGRFNPMNYFMIADYLLAKYYPGRNFSKNEIVLVADEIGRIKQQRNFQKGHSKTDELKSLQQLITDKLLLSEAKNVEPDWQFGEFAPRYDGVRAELGPWFSYYNREPDFLYGAYFKVEKQQYRNTRWNNKISAELNYYRYKRTDWMILEIDFGWSYFSELKSRFDFGIRYVPGVVLNNFDNPGPVRHNLIPYLGFFKQVNQNTRLQFDLAYRIAEENQFMVSGPQITLAVYKSKY